MVDSTTQLSSSSEGEQEGQGALVVPIYTALAKRETECNKWLGNISLHGIIPPCSFFLYEKLRFSSAPPWERFALSHSPYSLLSKISRSNLIASGLTYMKNVVSFALNLSHTNTMVSCIVDLNFFILFIQILSFLPKYLLQEKVRGCQDHSGSGWESRSLSHQHHLGLHHTWMQCRVRDLGWIVLPIFCSCHVEVKQKASACNKSTDVLSKKATEILSANCQGEKASLGVWKGRLLSTEFGGFHFIFAVQSVTTSLNSPYSIPCPGSAAGSGCAKTALSSPSLPRDKGLPGVLGLQ